jgi:hypothetical protein
MALLDDQEPVLNQDMTLDEIREMVRTWCEGGARWHFHALAPGCAFSAQRDRHALVLENRTDCQTYVVYSDEAFAEISQELVKMLHGESILDKEQARAASSNATFERILQHAQELRQRGIAWHHHMLFPDCILNRHRGKWNIVFEGDEDEEIVEMLYDEEPTADLRKIEVAYFG